MITLKDTQIHEERLKVLRVHFRELSRRRSKFLKDNPFLPFPNENEWDDLRIEWSITKGEFRIVTYNYKVLAMMQAIENTLLTEHDLFLNSLESKLGIKKEGQGYFTRAIYEMEDQGIATIKRDPFHDVPVPGSQISGVKYVPGHGVTKLVCGSCVIEGKTL